jgi:hypothetical protein
MDRTNHFGSADSGSNALLDVILLKMDDEKLELVRLLRARLERISVDLYWAHRASESDEPCCG